MDHAASLTSIVWRSDGCHQQEWISRKDFYAPEIKITIVCDRISSAILRCIKPNENVSQLYTLNNEAIEWDEDRSFKGIYDDSNEIKWNNGNTWKKLSYCSSSEECPTDYPHCSSQWRSPDRFGEAFCTSGCEAVQVGNSSCPGKPSSRWRCNGLCLTG